MREGLLKQLNRRERRDSLRMLLRPAVSLWLALFLLWQITAADLFCLPVQEVQAAKELGETFNLKELKIKQIKSDKFAFKSLSGDLVEIGEERHSPPQPYLKLNKWDEEVSLKVNVPYGKNGKKSIAQDRLKWANPKYDVDFYPKEPEKITEKIAGKNRTFFINEEGGVEFDVILKEKPDSNVFEFPIETQGLKFYYQPPLHPEHPTWADTDGDGKADTFRPENVVGSYAVYHESRQGDYTQLGGKNYKTGKAFHIYRPKVTDAEGKEIWGKLNIDEKAGVLTVTIDQNWLDNAAYPVKIDPNFGYEVAGGSETSAGVNEMQGSLFTSPADVDFANSISVYMSELSPTQFKGIIVSHSDMHIITNGIGEATDLNTSYPTYSWHTSSFSTPPSLSPNTEYVLMWVVGDCTSMIKYDTGDTDQGHDDDSNSFASPSDPTDAQHTDYKFSIYCTYTSGSAAGVTVNPTSGLTTTEAGGTSTFTVVLTSEPTADVTIGLSSSDATEGTVSPSSLTFTPANWSTEQTVTITGVDDDVDDGDVAYTIVTANASSTDPNYNNLAVDDVSVTNTDNDEPGGGLPPVAYNPPTPPVSSSQNPKGEFKVLINNDAKYTNNSTVVLNLFGGPDTAKMAISNNPEFSGLGSTGQISYQPFYQWNLCQGKTACPGGKHAVYVKFYTQYGQPSQVVSDSIVYQKGITEEWQIEKMTVGELKEKIAEIKAKIMELQLRLIKLLEKRISEIQFKINET